MKASLIDMGSLTEKDFDSFYLDFDASKGEGFTCSFCGHEVSERGTSLHYGRMRGHPEQEPR